MKQLLQNMRDGKTMIVDVPTPQVKPGTALVKVHASLVSAGTERMLVEFAEKSLLGKVKSRPDLAKQVIDKARREGLIPTVTSAFNRLDLPMPLGYSSAGVIVAVGSGLKGFKVGDRVACAGGGHAVHAEYNLVPKNLLVKIPAEVDFESAAFTTLGAIGLNGFRLAQLQVGENVAIIGLGLLGLLVVEICKAAGLSVFGVDLDPKRIELAKRMGIKAVSRKDAEIAGLAFTQNKGFDAVLICADTPSNDTVTLAGAIARDRAHVISLGVVGIDLPRKSYYEKELFFQVSRSSGPGRYDLDYEEKGLDYPYGYIRWSEQRNMQAFLQLIADKRVNINPLITHRFEIKDAADAYTLITGKKKENYLGVLLNYPDSDSEKITTKVQTFPVRTNKPSSQMVGIGVLGAGNYASATFLPIVANSPVTCVGIASGSGSTAAVAAKKYHFDYASSNVKDIISDPAIQAVAILTRHNQHASQTMDALKAGKNVYCEKPLVINKNELDSIEKILQKQNTPILTVGFNRRFAPLSAKLKSFFKDRTEPMVIHYRVNAGYIPLNHWLQDPLQGGRLIGEGCHFIDYLSFLTGEIPSSVSAKSLPDHGKYNQDNFVLTFSFSDGSIGMVEYLSNGDKSLPKEWIEVFCEGKVARLNDFRSIEFYKNGNHSIQKDRFHQNKGHKNSWAAFLEAVKGQSDVPIPYAEIIGVHRAVFAAYDALTTELIVKI
jgi:predicted dehydrogenase